MQSGSHHGSCKGTGAEGASRGQILRQKHIPSTLLMAKLNSLLANQKAILALLHLSTLHAIQPIVCVNELSLPTASREQQI